MTDAEAMVAFAREHFADDLGDMVEPEEIGRLLVARCSAGARLWCGMRILRSLGVLAEPDGHARPN